MLRVVGDFARQVKDFLACGKSAARRFLWSIGRHKDYAEARFVVRCAKNDGLGEGMVVLSAHLLRQPPKYSFALVYAGQRILGLDVEPARLHVNPISLEVIKGTHWQEWPCDIAVPDARNMGYRAWFQEFLERANIQYPYPYAQPPQGKQIGLSYDDA